MKRIFIFSLFAFFSFAAYSQTSTPGVVQTTMVANPGVVQAIMVIDNLHYLNLAEVKQEIGYPKAAIDNQVRGTLEYFVTFDENGKVADFNQLTMGHALLSEAVEKKILSLKIEPWKLDNKPSKVIGKVTFEFK